MATLYDLNKKALSLKDDTPLNASLVSINNMAYACRETFQFPEAIDLTQQLLKNKTDNHPKTYYKLIQLYVLNNEWEKALSTSEFLAGLQPGNIEFLNIYGFVLAKLQKWESAFKILHKSLKINADNKDTLFNMGMVLSHMERFQTSNHFLNKAVASSSDEIIAYLYLARNACLSANPDHAVSVIDQMLKHFPLGRILTALNTDYNKSIYPAMDTSMITAVLSKRLSTDISQLKHTVDGSEHHPEIQHFKWDYNKRGSL
ncbi:MAG: hypothetical protein V1793_11095 [Pseudomonadota bacterium]